MKDTGRIFIVLVVVSVTAYLCLHTLRSFNVAAEWRGLWAGAAADLVGRLFVDGVSSRRRRRR